MVCPVTMRGEKCKQEFDPCCPHGELHQMHVDCIGGGCVDCIDEDDFECVMFKIINEEKVVCDESDM